LKVRNALPAAQRLRIIPRAADLLDYTPGGMDFNAAAAVLDIGAADEVHGESGDDVVYGMAGSDVMFGEGQDDDLIGGYGNDWASGGTGEDALLGDDGRIMTSRNGLTEPLYGLLVPAVQQDLSTPGKIQQATIHVTGKLKKAVNLTPFNVDPADQPTTQPVLTPSDDILFGGLGDDWLHGGVGDDAISGAEALGESYIQRYDSAGTLIGVARSDYTRPYNPGNALRFNPDDVDSQRFDRTRRAGEFALYDEYEPMRQILLTDAGALSKTGAGKAFFLNFSSNEGVPIDSSLGIRLSDGYDALFGDLGNDWIVGGTGRDDMYGGYGNDLLNADDLLGTSAGLNDLPDSHPSYEDRAYGGAGRDVLIGNTGGDRLIDWVGEFNSFLVPFAPYGAAAITRALQPQLAEYLYALSAGDGADPTRAGDTGADPARNGEPRGELGVVLQQDFDWQVQTGAPTDPQAGNIPGGSRDVLRSSSFNDARMQGFVVDSGSWSVVNGALQVAPPSLGHDAVAVYHVGDALPTYFEVMAAIRVIKPLAGWKANAYIVFDYQGPNDFKFAGINVSIDKLVMGHRDATGWYMDEQTPFQAKPDQYYSMLLAINGTTASLVVNNTAVFTHTYAARVIAGVSYGLNSGLVGMGADNSRGSFDDVAVRVLPPQITFQATEGFDTGRGPMFGAAAVGSWTASGGRYAGTPLAGADEAISLVTLGVERLRANSALDLSATLRTTGRAGFVFDRYSDDDLKFAAIDVVTDQVLIGHRTPRGSWKIDAVASATLDPGVDYVVGLVLRGPTVSVSLNGQTITSYGYNGTTVDGRFGLLSQSGVASFDQFSLKTNDQGLAGYVLPAAPDASSAMAVLTPADAVTVTQSSLLEAAVWLLQQGRPSHPSGMTGADPALGLPITLAPLPPFQPGDGGLLL
jgi:Ca2+-binding RTX toxin-like protein